MEDSSLPPISPLNLTVRRGESAGAHYRIKATETKLKRKFMTLFQTNILKLTKTANQIWSPGMQGKLNGHLYLTTRNWGESGHFPVPRGMDEECIRDVAGDRELRCTCPESAHRLLISAHLTEAHPLRGPYTTVAGPSLSQKVLRKPEDFCFSLLET